MSRHRIENGGSLPAEIIDRIERARFFRDRITRAFADSYDMFYRALKQAGEQLTDELASLSPELRTSIGDVVSGFGIDPRLNP